MSNILNTNKYMVPYFKNMDLASLLSKINGKIEILMTNFDDDFQKNYLKNMCSKHNAVTKKDIECLKKNYKLCYYYETLDFENIEFTIQGYDAIRKDIHRIIDSGFTYIMLSNPYIIELICNEYSNDIKIIVSSQLEFNSERAKIFFEVINDTSCIESIVISQKHLSVEKFKRMKNCFKGLNLISEIDRFSSEIQMVHEQYYNTIYGYYNENAVKYLKELTLKITEDNNKYGIKDVSKIIFDNESIIKFGSPCSTYELLEHNITSFESGNIENIKCCDLLMW
ncbi:MAG: hypothetical protein GY750_16885 [Lentisphaerae bacterium]|nr:hypothetical protein [Lentisphaerota bacterium]